jgi:hypothetical protein
VPCLRYAALGDSAVRVIALDYAIRHYNLDAIIVPPLRSDLLPLWQAAFKEEIVCDPALIPVEFQQARVSAPTSLDWSYGSHGWNAFEGILWESGFFLTQHLRIDPPILFPCNPASSAVMIYPEEHTDCNRVYDSDWWTSTCKVLRARGHRIHYLGGGASSRLQLFYETISFDRRFPPTIDGLRECIASSGLAIGGSTGPTWTCLMSDIPQIVLESKISPHGYWHFDRCQEVLTKRLTIVSTMDGALRQLAKQKI